MPSEEYKGSCVCGQTTYIAFDLNDISYCHCEQCRKMTGHFMAASQVSRENIKIKGKIKWFYTHEGSRHGFCDNCGANMFWQNDNKPTISVTPPQKIKTPTLKIFIAKPFAASPK